MNDDGMIEIQGLPFVTQAWLKKEYKVSNGMLDVWKVQRVLPKPVRIGKRLYYSKVEFEDRLRSG